MILRGMHDTGSDDVWIIVTDMKRQEMDDVTAYFQLVCRHSFGRDCKQSMEEKIQLERASCSAQVFLCVLTSFFRHALNSCTSPTTTDTLLSPNRPHLPSDSAREAPSFHRPLLSSDDLLFPDSLHPPLVRPR